MTDTRTSTAGTHGTPAGRPAPRTEPPRTEPPRTEPPPAEPRRPSTALRVAHRVITVAHGLLALFLIGLWGIAVVRGPFFGLVEHGPFGPETWGGPTLAGAWAVHAAVAVPVIVLIPLALLGIRRLHTTMTREPLRWWTWPVAVLIAVAGVVLFVAWLQQL
ncbi:hypothetical protein [Kribbella italica]|uniref:Uncharacterized membrane protein YhaH (DUF805 family) n=1 Tax=Kribbella italica TaxID=1540520 RepID=A0A7W9J7E2_9ACTN|nr:hypothetical protein [Kribbella italica]MBB5836263.1 uncharacterized membrane protein YhaH (DUF805 family) [Kribbella italica]